MRVEVIEKGTGKSGLTKINPPPRGNLMIFAPAGSGIGINLPNLTEHPGCVNTFVDALRHEIETQGLVI